MKIKEEVEVTKIQFGVASNDGFITLRFPYGYSKIEGKFKKGDRIDVILTPVKKVKGTTTTLSATEPNHPQY